jgi:hypothetical protein
MRQRDPREHDKRHLEFVRQLPCLICRNNIQSEAAHIRMGDMSVAKRPTGMQEKPDDAFTVPLCGEHHRQQHEINEKRFWEYAGMDAIKIALALWRVSGDQESGELIVRNAVSE